MHSSSVLVVRVDRLQLNSGESGHQVDGPAIDAEVLASSEGGTTRLRMICSSLDRIGDNHR